MKMVIFLFIQLADYYFSSWKLAKLKLLYHTALLGVSFQSGFPYFNSLQSCVFSEAVWGEGGWGAFIYGFLPNRSNSMINKAEKHKSFTQTQAGHKAKGINLASHQCHSHGKASRRTDSCRNIPVAKITPIFSSHSEQ